MDRIQHNGNDHDRSIILNGTRTRNSIEGRESAYRLDTCNHKIPTSEVHGK